MTEPMSMEAWIDEDWEPKDALVEDPHNPLVRYHLSRFKLDGHRMFDICTFYGNKQIFSLTIKDPDAEALLSQWRLTLTHARMVAY